MADTHSLELQQSFINSSSITVTHNLNKEALAIQVIVDGEKREDLIKELIPTAGNYLNEFTLHLTEQSSGIVQVFSSSMYPVGILTIEKKIALGPRMDFSLGRGEETQQDTYSVIDSFSFQGTQMLGIPKQIMALVQQNATSSDIRIYDVNNGNVIAETNFTNTQPALINLGTLSNLPTSPTLFEMHLRRNGQGNQKARVRTIHIEW